MLVFPTWGFKAITKKPMGKAVTAVFPVIDNEEKVDYLKWKKEKEE